MVYIDSPIKLAWVTTQCDSAWPAELREGGDSAAPPVSFETGVGLAGTLSLTFSSRWRAFSRATDKSSLIGCETDWARWLGQNRLLKYQPSNAISDKSHEYVGVKVVWSQNLKHIPPTSTNALEILVFPLEWIVKSIGNHKIWGIMKHIDLRK